MTFEQHWLEHLLAAPAFDFAGGLVEVLEPSQDLVALLQVQHLRLHLAHFLYHILGSRWVLWTFVLFVTLLILLLVIIDHCKQSFVQSFVFVLLGLCCDQLVLQVCLFQSHVFQLLLENIALVSPLHYSRLHHLQPFFLSPELTGLLLCSFPFLFERLESVFLCPSLLY